MMSMKDISIKWTTESAFFHSHRKIVTTQCDTLTDYWDAKRRDCFESFVFLWISNGMTQNWIEFLNLCTNGDILMWLLPAPYSSRFAKCKSIDVCSAGDSRRQRRKSIDYVHICWWFLPHRMSINQQKRTQNWKLCLPIGSSKCLQTEINRWMQRKKKEFIRRLL